MLIPLKEMIQVLDVENELIPLLSSFTCKKDHDIENFLHTRAIDFENLLKARTYLVFNAEDMQNKALQEIKILGYISLAQKVLTVPEETSNRIRKNIDGFSAKLHGERINEFPTYLIGQLGRASDVSSQELPGSKLIEYADSVIENAVRAVGGRTTLIECHNRPELLKFYRDNGFEVIGKEPDDNVDMVQMIRIKYL